ncbi:MAG: HDOD domain-containing protein [Polyangiaceae bacterium]
MRVLFVDDEPRVLEALERSLFQLDVEWEASFANSGPAAVLELERADYDVIVSDMRMPGMDGAALLGHAREKHPHVARIVLSGQTDEAAAVRAARVAHQFLVKPCSAATLRRVIERTLELSAWLSDETLRAKIGQVERLPSTPRLFAELSQLLDDEATTIDSVVAVVRQDPAMSSKLLQVVNSSFFAASSNVSDVRTAVLRLGLKTIRNLALGIGAFDAVGALATSAISVEKLQQRSLRIARLASRIAVGREDPDAAFMAGLTCDVGELVVTDPAPAEPGDPEQRRITHAEVGAFLLGLWGLPFPIVEAVSHHHHPDRNPYDRFGLPQIVWLASCLVHGEKPDAAYLTRIGVADSLSKFEGMQE